jgi:hypothetical protein
LKILTVSKTCGCTPFILEKTEYAPGESGVLIVKFFSSKRPGATTKHLFVTSNDKTNPRITLTIEAQIVLQVEHEPKSLNLLLNKENAGCPEITLTSVGGQPFAVSGFKSTDDCVTADYDPSVKSDKFVLTPKVNIEKLQEVLNGSIDISLTHPKCDLVSISFTTLPRFKVNPPTLVILRAEPQKPEHKTVWVLNNYNGDFEVASVSSDKGMIKVLSQEKIDNRYKFELEITPPDVKDKTKARTFWDVFRMGIKGGEELKVTCNGYYSKEALNTSSR